MNEIQTIEKIFRECRTIAVVGLSSNPYRPSNSVAAFMKENGYRIIPVNPNEIEVLGEKAFPNLSSVLEKIDLVSIFRRSEKAGETVDEAIRVGAKAVWMQEGVIDRIAAKRAESAGLMVVMDRCWARDFAKYKKGILSVGRF
ncbi:MAG: CoA-binding protein [Pyrinomonadaceae bacterium]|nr:CoA-binding protein [Pyrinomonadaceae bacterium]